MKARKKPILIDAYKIENEGFLLCAPDWISEACLNNVIHGYAKDFNKGVRIETIEGAMFVPYGYYIIRGVEGEIYGCDPNIVAKTYEILEEVQE